MPMLIKVFHFLQKLFGIYNTTGHMLQDRFILSCPQQMLRNVHDFDKTAIVRKNFCVFINHQNAVYRSFLLREKQYVLYCQGFFSTFAFGDIKHDSHQATQRTVLIMEGGLVENYLPLGPVRIEDGFFIGLLTRTFKQLLVTQLE